MKIVVISDVHDNITNLKTCLGWCRDNKIEMLFCCGDLTNTETLDCLAAEFSGPIHLVKGNCNLYDDSRVKKYPHISYYGQIGRFELGNIFVGLCHEPHLFDSVLKNGHCDIIFYGHTHKPWISSGTGEGKTIKLINPGNIGGFGYRATFTFWDTKKNKLELKILENIYTNN